MTVPYSVAHRRHLPQAIGLGRGQSGFWNPNCGAGYLTVRVPVIPCCLCESKGQ